MKSLFSGVKLHFSRINLIEQYMNYKHIIPTYVTSTVCVICVKTVKNDQHYYSKLSCLRNTILIKHDSIIIA